MKAQEYLDFEYPKEERKLEKQVYTSQEITGDLDLSDFINLEKLILYTKSSVELKINKNYNLREVVIWCCKIKNDLNIFSHLTSLKKIDLGSIDDIKFISELNDFRGSLKSLENCKQLEHLCIGNQSNIKGGLEYLPLDNLKYFGCWGTEYQDILRPFDYDIKAWKLVNHPEMFTNPRELIKQKLEQTKRDLEAVKKAKLSHEVKRIARLESKIQKLKATLTKNFSSMELKEQTNKVEKKPIHLHHWLDTVSKPEQSKPNHIQAEIETKRREIKREYELLEKEKQHIDYKRDRSDGLSFLMEDKWEEDLNRHHKRIQALEEEVKQLELQSQTQIPLK